MQHDFTMKDQSGDCIGSAFLIRGAVPVSEVSLVLQAGHSHHIYPSWMTPYLQALGFTVHEYAISTAAHDKVITGWKGNGGREEQGKRGHQEGRSKISHITRPPPPKGGALLCHVLLQW